MSIKRTFNPWKYAFFGVVILCLFGAFVFLSRQNNPENIRLVTSEEVNTATEEFCAQDADCKLIYNNCSCDAVLSSNPRNRLEDDGKICKWNDCIRNSRNDVKSVCQNQRCVRSDQVSNSNCNLQGIAGPCKAFIPAYYFDKTTQQCVKFIYGGCAPGTRPFTTQTECENSCLIK